MGIKEINYDIQFEPIFSNFTFKGIEILSFVTSPSNKFILNCAEIKLRKCYILSKSKTIDTKFKHNPNNETLSITTKQKVSGKIKLKLYKGNITIISRQTNSTAYSLKKASFEESKTFKSKNVENFIKKNFKKL